MSGWYIRLLPEYLSAEEGPTSAQAQVRAAVSVEAQPLVITLASALVRAAASVEAGPLVITDAQAQVRAAVSVEAQPPTITLAQAQVRAGVSVEAQPLTITVAEAQIRAPVSVEAQPLTITAAQAQVRAAVSVEAQGSNLGVIVTAQAEVHAAVTVLARAFNAAPVILTYGTRDELLIVVRGWDGTTWDFSTDRQRLRIGTVAPGGDEVASWTYSALRPYTLPPMASHVEIADGEGVFWIGRTGKPRLQADHDHADISLTAYGYSHAAGDLRVKQELTFAAGTAIEAAIKSVRNNYAPELSSNDSLIVATGRTFTVETRDFRGQTAAQIWSELVTYGNSNDDPLEWLIWNGGAGGIPQLELKVRPTSAAYVAALSDGISSGDEWDLNDLENRVTLEWTNSDGDTVVTTVGGSSTIISGLTGRPVVRDKWVPAHEAVADSSDATNLANSLLAKFSPIRFSGNQIIIGDNALILDASANALPPWRVRAGNLISITDHTTADGLLSDTRYIVQTDYDGDEGILTLSMGDLHGMIRKIKRALQDQSTLPEAGAGPGSGNQNAGGGFSVKRDFLPENIIYTGYSFPGKQRRNVAAIDHQHAAKSGWGGVFGDGQTIGTATPTAPLIVQGHAPYPAIVTGAHLSVYPSTAGNVSWSVYVNGNFVQSLSGSNGYTTVIDPPIAVQAGDQLRFEYYGPAGGGSPTSVTCELIVGRGV